MAPAPTVPGTTEKISFLLNWHPTPYHLPIFIAKSLGYFSDEGINVAIMSPTDPSDVTEMIGTGRVEMGAKAMVHTIAGKARGFPIKSIGTLMDEPFTGVVYLEGSGITEDFTSLKGKRIGYVGEFGKIQIDELTKWYGMVPSDYTAVRVGMNVSGAIIDGTIDAGIGLENVQCVELEDYCLKQGRPTTDVKMLRIDVLAELGCCCFCSILIIANDEFLAANPKRVASFMRAVKRATDLLHADPAAAWAEYCRVEKTMNTPLNFKIFERSFVYMSKDMSCVARDWNKVVGYCKRLGVIEGEFVPNYTNEFIQWDMQPDLVDPDANQILVAKIQENVKSGHGVLGLAPSASAGIAIVA